MTFDEYYVELARLVAQTGSFRTLASRYVRGADVDTVAQHVFNELSLLCPEVIAGIQRLGPYAQRAIWYRVLDLVKDRNRDPQHPDIAAATLYATEHSGGRVLIGAEEGRKLLRDAVNLLDRQDQAVLAALLHGQPISRTAKRLGVTVDVAREARRRSLSKLREIVDELPQASLPSGKAPYESDQSCVAARIQAADWVIELYAPKPTARLLPRFLAWFNASPAHSDEYLCMERVWRRLVDLHDRRLLSHLPLPGPATILPAGQTAVIGSWPIPPSPYIPLRPLWTKPLLVAACVALLIFAAAVLYRPHLERAQLRASCATCNLAQGRFASDYGRLPAPLDLIDGSQISLNANSQVTLDLSLSHRRVRLDRGEALFRIRHNTIPFDVQVGAVSVKVLGTTFSIENKGLGGTEILVLEGRVRVLTMAHSPVDVGAGQGIQINADGTRLDPLSTSRVKRGLAWTAGRLEFDGETLVQAAAAFNRYNRRQITVEAEIAERTIAGRVRSNDPEGFAKAMKLVLGVEYSVLKDPNTGVETIRLRGKLPHRGQVDTPDNRDGLAGRG